MTTDKSQISWHESGKQMFNLDLSKSEYFVQTFTNLNILKLTAVLSASFGTSNKREIVGAALSHLMYTYYFNQVGIDAIYSFLGGSLLQKKKYTYATLPLLSDLLDSVNDLSDTKTLTQASWTKNGIFALGFLSAYLKFV